MSRRRGFSRAASSRGPKNNVWTTILAEDVDIGAGGLSGFNIVQDSDWTASAGSERATILRVRGWLTVHNKTSTGIRGDGAFFLGIFLLDSDAATPNPSVASTYVDEDTLWTGGGMFTITDTNATGHVTDLLPDVKAMRKMRKGQELRIAVASPGLTNLRVSFVLRALLRKGGN